MKFKYTPYSFSKISTWEQCPRKFKYQYINKLPVERTPQIHLDRGKFIHLLLEHDGDLEKLKKTKDWKEIKEHGLMSKDAIKDSYWTYLKFKESYTGKSILKRKSLLKEFPLGLNENLEIIEYDSKDVVLRGYIDAMYVDEKTDTLIVVDWKTGKVPEKQSYKQLLFYSLGIFSKMPEEYDKILLVYAYIDHQVINKQVLYRKDLERYKKALYDNIEKIESDTEFVKEESGLCQFCDYFLVCQEDN